jgi:hypothetical protein
MRTLWLGLAFGLVLGVGTTRADVWDTAADSDNTTGTDNVPVHGTIQVHDMSVQPGPATDQDWYTISLPAFTSYEAIIDGLTGDTGGSLTFDWLAADGTTILASGVSLGSASCTACTQTARLANQSASAVPVFIRVANPACGTACNTADQYTFRLKETDISVPRFNNASGQTTVLIMHNVSELPITGNINLFNGAGTLLGTLAFTLASNAHQVTNLGTVPGAAGVAGVVRITNNGRYGGLAGKTVALDPATGFSFDTPFVYRP